MIALDTSTDGGTATATSLTFAHTCSGNNRILFVAVSNNTSDNTDYVTGVTYGGVSMTQVESFHSPGLGGHELYALLNPATGANNVVISASGSVALYGVASSYTGVKQEGQPDAENSATSDPVTTLSASVTTTETGSWLVSSAGHKAGVSSTISAHTNTTARQVNNYVAIGDSNAIQTVGSVSQAWNQTENSGLTVIVASIAPAPDEGGFIYMSV